MYLKRLEIQGFKSLADKIDLQFNQGISVVVGPNGCGKSNIADAIRWVLGEQSAKSLRGAKMEDVIFAGSDKRKPVGMAEVSLTLDNSTSVFPLDFSEITVTRRVYRSGESEYLINKSACRLKDIHELFMDTGIGREGYSIIGQGKIDEILSVKSEERRQIIEEAAGIVKYKTRKLQAERKLDDTEQNLIRINDIISELETQIGPLEEQSQKATEYLQYKEELDQLEVNLLVNQVHEQKEKLSEINTREEELKRELIESETRLRNTESQYEEQKLLLNKLDEEISVLQKAVYETGSLIEKQESGIRVAAERLNSIDSQKENTISEISELREKEQREKDLHTEDEQKLNDVRDKLNQENKKLEELELELVRIEADFQEEQKKIEDGKADIIDLLNEIAGVRNTVSSGETQVQSLLKRAVLLEEQNKGSDDEFDKVKQKLLQLEKARLDTENEISGQNRQEQNFLTKRDGLQNEIRVMQIEANKVRTQLQDNRSKLKALEDLRSNYDGYYRGVKEVLKANSTGRDCPGICGVVAELIKVPEKYEIAVEVALGGSLQFLVTDTDDDARQAIEFLKKNRAGRATFLPLNTIKTGKDKPGIRGNRTEGLIGRASELVSCDTRYKPIVEYLLGRILIADNIKHATELARVSDSVSRMVTLDGDVVNPGGAMTGGSFQKGSSGLLGRVRETEETANLIKKLEQENENFDKELSKKQKELEQVISEIGKITVNLQDLRMKKSALQKDVEFLLQEKSRIEDNRQFMERELQSLYDEIKNTKCHIERQNELLVELQARDVQTRNSIEENKNLMAEREKDRAVKAEQVTKTKVGLGALQQEEINLAQILGRVMSAIKEIREQIKRKEAQISEFDSLKESLGIEINNMEEEIKKLNRERGITQELLEKQRNDRQSSLHLVSENEDKIKKITKSINQQRDQLHSLDVRRARLELEIENSMSKLFEEFNLSFEEAFLRKTEIANRKEVTTRIRQLKEAISSMGSVNTGAIEEFTRVKERYDFLTGQYEDLTQAKESLFKVIEEMEQIMTKKFSKAFTEINENFGVVFSKLFGGGKAVLIMTDPENLLESGIEILAQPPGKKNQHLSLLSGGEKALTAISLLFAILMTKPSPFCVLDEIEAALDEANVDRFAMYLKEFSLGTQFIVISHRKGTMEAADVLFGVTMDESKVTKLVSMKLSEAVDKVS